MTGSVTDPVTYEVIVHSAGRWEQNEAYWSEVPALSACMGEGAALDEVVEDTRRVIVAWLQRTRGAAPEVRIAADYAL